MVKKNTFILMKVSPSSVDILVLKSYRRSANVCNIICSGYSGRVSVWASDWPERVKGGSSTSIGD